MPGVSKRYQLAIQQDFESATMSSSVICTVLHQGRSYNQECEAPSPRLYDKLKLQKKKKSGVTAKCHLTTEKSCCQ